jgi:hypothetical protein
MRQRKPCAMSRERHYPAARRRGPQSNRLRRVYLNTSCSVREWAGDAGPSDGLRQARSACAIGVLKDRGPANASSARQSLRWKDESFAVMKLRVFSA